MSQTPEPRDAAGWAPPVQTLSVADGHINVSGRRPTAPIHGFGKMWQKTYRISLRDIAVSPREVITLWKEHFPEFWPAKSKFFAPLAGIAPGEVAALDLGMPGGMKLSTGVLVLFADDESFTLMTPQGHMFAGWITFSSFVEDGDTQAQAQVLMRASDPLYELGMIFGGHRQEDKHWVHTLSSLAARLGADDEVIIKTVCVDKRREWSRVSNVWQNAGIRSALYMLGAPVRALHRSSRPEA
ncbi:MAG: hypothetical protein ACLP8S_11980 [Solirubrobacteraceae bacterium]|jgi:hypothetical protein